MFISGYFYCLFYSLANERAWVNIGGFLVMAEVPLSAGTTDGWSATTRLYVPLGLCGGLDYQLKAQS
jgi:hypothetical protein